MAEYNPSKIIKDGNTYNFRDTTKIPLAGSNQISGSLIPSTDGTVNLGSVSYQWNNAYIKSLTINGVACGDILTHNASEFVPRSGGAVLTGTSLGRADNTSRIILCGGTDSTKGGSITIYSKGQSTGDIAFQCFDGDTRNAILRLHSNGAWSWTGQPIQYTSDQRLKQQITEIDDKLLDAWQDIDLVQFKYNDAVDQKGKDKARLHTGYVVQQIDDACKSHGVDISKYGLYCHEEYEEETREVEQADGTKKTEVVRPASEHYSLRYTEALIVECAYLRKKLKELTARIEQLEKGNNTK